MESDSVTDRTDGKHRVNSAQGQLVTGRDVLRGLGAVAVVVADPGPEAAQDGLSESRLQTVTELALRSAGIRIEAIETLNKSRRENPKFRTAVLWVSVDTVKGGGLYAYSMNVELHEVMQFLDGSGEASGTTWTRGSVGTVASSKVSILADDVREFVEEFANDYLAANPR